MSTAIKPKQGVVYECYKGFTDQFGDRCRAGQKFTYDGDNGMAEENEYYTFDKASGRGIQIAVPLDKFMAHFIPAEQQSETKPKFKVGDKVMINDDSVWYDQGNSNPANVEGVIIEIYDEDLGIVVKWSNSTTNSYNDRDLLLWKAKPKSYLDGVENKDSKQLKENNMNLNLSAIAITDLEQIKAIAELIPSVKEQIMAQYPQLFESEVKHKVGNKYEHSDGSSYILIGEHEHVALANLATGMVESRTVSVVDYNNITADEFEGLCEDTEELELIEL
jgi:hypothetical protein